MTPTETVEAFIAAWNRLDFDAVYGLMAEDIVWHNIPMPPMTGIPACKAMIDTFPPMQSCDWETHHIAANGNVVLVERTDAMSFEGAPNFRLPVVGVFEINDDGKIAKWRDYFDLAQMQKGLSNG